MKTQAKRWVVRSGDGATVAEILKHLGEDERVVLEGRVFVGRVRVTRAEAVVSVGDEVRIGAPVHGSLSILWTRDGLLACDKPAGMPTVPDHAGASHSLVALAAEELNRRIEGSESPLLREKDLLVTSRLDREVSGVVVFATTADAEARLKRAREEGVYARRYVAIASGELPEPRGIWDAPIGRGKDARHRSAKGPDAKTAQTRWARVATAGGFTMLAVAPQTGRTHQIRVHASHAGAPLLGDRDYGGTARVTLAGGRVVALARIALHAARVTIPDEAGAPLVAEAPIPLELMRVWTDLGGNPEAWDRAVSCELEA